MKHLNCITQVRRADTDDVIAIIGAVTSLLMTIIGMIPAITSALPNSEDPVAGGSFVKIGEKIGS